MEYNLLVRLITLLLIIMVINRYNQYNDTKNISAKKGKYSSSRSYSNSSLIKSIILSNIFFSLMPVILFNKKKLIFSVNEFEKSLVGDITIYIVSILIYYEILQPYIINIMPNFF